VTAGDRIAQLIVMPVSRARFVPVERLPGSHRADGGFGSTGYAQQGASA
jgi:dUTP pyrophosphatase